jgi:hypothetical protein
VPVTPGSTTSKIDAALTDTSEGEISGTVTDTSVPAKDLQGIDVEVLSSEVANGVDFGEDVVVGRGCTGPGGRYLIGGLLPGSYSVAFDQAAVLTQAGLQSCSASDDYGAQYYKDISPSGIGHPYPSSTPATVTANADADTPSIDAALTALGTIAGTVSDMSGDQLADISVDVYDTSDDHETSTCTGTAGTYTVAELPPGSYVVAFAQDDQECSGSPNFIAQYYTGAPGGTASFADAAPVGVSGLATTPVDASLAREHRGRRVRHLGRLRRGRLHRTCPGRATDYLPQYYKGATSLTGAETLTVTEASDLTGLDAALTPSGEISGTVTDAASTDPIGDVVVEAFDSDGDVVATACTSTAAGSTRRPSRSPRPRGPSRSRACRAEPRRWAVRRRCTWRTGPARPATRR